MFKEPKDNDKYTWTKHAVEKMKYYRIYPGRVKRVIRSPEREELGVADDTVASMQVAGTKNREEIWVMYQPTSQTPSKYKKSEKEEGEKIRIITAWRYPGESPERDPVPDDVMNEVKTLL